jgi:hypothetical protein
MCAGTEIPAWVQAIGALIAIITAVWMWAHDRRRDRRDRDSRAVSFAISLVPVLERAQQRIAAQTDQQGLWELYNEHSNDAWDTHKVVLGLPGLLSEAHLLPPDVARQIQSFWSDAQQHDALVDRIRRAQAAQSSDREKLRQDLEASGTSLVDAVRIALDTLQTYVRKDVGKKRQRL